MTHKNLGNTIYILLWIVFGSIFIAANHVKVVKYPIYSMKVWAIKAEEGYRSWWYPDGRTKTGKQKYSIGYGWNDLGGERRHEIKKYTSDGKVTKSEALDIVFMEMNKWGVLHSDPYKNLAMQLYSYNCGRITSGSRLGKCHNGSNIPGKRCGHWNPDVRRVHNRRREFELALWKHDWIKIQKYTEMNKNTVINRK